MSIRTTACVWLALSTIALPSMADAQRRMPLDESPDEVRSVPSDFAAWHDGPVAHVRLRLAEGEALTLYRWTGDAWATACTPPCTTRVTVGAHRFAISRRRDDPSPLPADVTIATDSIVELAYEDRSGQRAVGGVMLGVGLTLVAGGSGVLYIGVTSISAGAFGGAILGLLLVPLGGVALAGGVVLSVIGALRLMRSDRALVDVRAVYIPDLWDDGDAIPSPSPTPPPRE